MTHLFVFLTDVQTRQPGGDVLAVRPYTRTLNLAASGCGFGSISVSDWYNVLWMHHASAHGGLFDLISKMLD